MKRISRENFEIISLLGVGAYSRVYLSQNIESGEYVAMKVVKKQQIYSNGTIQRVMTERQILTLLGKHPNIISLMYAFQYENCLYFILEYASGGSLADVLSVYKKKISRDLISFWICDIVNILKYLRLNKVIHNDFKLDNLMLDDLRRLRLIDFNSSFIISNHIKNDYDKLHSLVSGGTLPYLAPEVMITVASVLFEDDAKLQESLNSWKDENQLLLKQFNYSSESIHARDIWSAGCVIFYLLCGESPFQGTTDQETVMNVLNRNCKIPDYLKKQEKDFLEQMLTLNPIERIGVVNINGLEIHPFISSLNPQEALVSINRPTILDSVNELDSDSFCIESFECTPDIGCKFGTLNERQFNQVFDAATFNLCKKRANEIPDSTSNNNIIESKNFCYNKLINIVTSNKKTQYNVESTDFLRCRTFSGGEASNISTTDSSSIVSLDGKSNQVKKKVKLPLSSIILTVVDPTWIRILTIV